MKLKNSLGFIQIPLLIGLLVMAVVIPIVTKLVQDNQDNRNKAAYQCSSLSLPTTVCKINNIEYGWTCNTATGLWTCVVKTVKEATPTVAGKACTPSLADQALGVPSLPSGGSFCQSPYLLGSRKFTCNNGVMSRTDYLTTPSCASAVATPTGTGACTPSVADQALGVPALPNGGVYCQSPYLAGSRKFTCSNGVMSRQDFINTPSCQTVALTPTGTGACTPSVADQALGVPPLANGGKYCQSPYLLGSRLFTCSNGVMSRQDFISTPGCSGVVTPTGGAGACIPSLADQALGIPSLNNGGVYCQSPYLAGSRKFTCSNGVMSRTDYLTTPGCTGAIATPTGSGACIPSLADQALGIPSLNNGGVYCQSPYLAGSRKFTCKNGVMSRTDYLTTGGCVAPIATPTGTGACIPSLGDQALGIPSLNNGGKYCQSPYLLGSRLFTCSNGVMSRQDFISTPGCQAVSLTPTGAGACTPSVADRELGVPALANGGKYCQSPYLLGSRLFTCKNGVMSRQDFLTTPGCSGVVTPTGGAGTCIPSLGDQALGVPSLPNGGVYCQSPYLAGSRKFTCSNGVMSRTDYLTTPGCTGAIATPTGTGACTPSLGDQALGVPPLANGTSYCQSPYLLGSRKFTCKNGVMSRQDFINTPSCQGPIATPTGAVACTPSLADQALGIPSLSNGSSYCQSPYLAGSRKFTCSNGVMSRQDFITTANCTGTPYPTLGAGGCRYYFAGINEALTNGQSKCYNLAGVGFLSSMIKCTNGTVNTTATYIASNCQGAVPTGTGGCLPSLADQALGVPSMKNGATFCESPYLAGSRQFTCSNGVITRQDFLVTRNCQSLLPTAAPGSCNLNILYAVLGLPNIPNGGTYCQSPYLAGSRLFRCTNGVGSVQDFMFTANCTGAQPTVSGGSCTPSLADNALGVPSLPNGGAYCQSPYLAGSRLFTCKNGVMSRQDFYLTANCTGPVPTTTTKVCTPSVADQALGVPTLNEGGTYCQSPYLAGSRKFTCSNGVMSRQDFITTANCTGTPYPTLGAGGCRYYFAGINEALTNGQSKCYNLAVGSYLSSMIKCTNGTISTTATYLAQNCQSLLPTAAPGSCNLNILYAVLGLPNIPNGGTYCQSPYLAGSRLFRCTNGVGSVQDFMFTANCTGAQPTVSGGSCTPSLADNALGVPSLPNGGAYCQSPYLAGSRLFTCKNGVMSRQDFYLTANCTGPVPTTTTKVCTPSVADQALGVPTLNEGGTYCQSPWLLGSRLFSCSNGVMSRKDFYFTRNCNNGVVPTTIPTAKPTKEVTITPVITVVPSPTGVVVTPPIGHTCPSTDQTYLNECFQPQDGGCGKFGCSSSLQSQSVKCCYTGQCVTAAEANVCAKGSWVAVTACSNNSACSSTPTGEPTEVVSPTGVVSPTIPAGMCKQCPNDFKCYSDASGEYKWFVTGYVMEGFIESADANCGGVAKPSFLGKQKGDANCDGFINVSDYSLWHKEFYDGDAGSIVSDAWNADFTGPNGVCDGVVDVSDYSLWHKYFYELIGNN